MNRTKLVFLNTLAQAVEQVIGILVSLTTFVVLARFLGASAYGQYSIITTYLGFFAVSADWSLYLLVVKAIVASPDREVRATAFGRIAAFRLILAVPCLVVGLLLLAFFPYVAIVKIGIIIGSLAFLASSFSQLINGIFQAELKLYWTALLDLIYRVLVLVFAVAAIHFKLGLLMVVAGMIIAAALTLLTGILISRPYAPFAWRHIRITRDQLREVFNQSWALGLNGLFSNLLYRIDLIVLSFFVSTAIVGVYALPEKIMEVIAILPGAFIGSVFPIISEYYLRKDTARIEQSVKRSVSFLVIMGAFLTAFIFMFAVPIVNVAGGSQFRGSVIALQILAFYPLFAFLGNFYYHLAVITNQQRSLIWRTGSVLLLNIILNLIFIPIFSFKAAAVVTLITEFIGAIISGYIVYRALKVRYLEPIQLIKIVAGALLVSLLAAAAYQRLADQVSFVTSRSLTQGLTVVGLGLLAAVVYAVYLLATKTISKDDFQALTRR